MSPVYIIAEAGVNHNGDAQLAEQMVDTAAEAGADAVKFQTFKADKLLTASAPKATYQQQTTDSEESQHAMIKKLELDRVTHKRLQERCRLKGIDFLSSPFDLDSIDLLADMQLPLFKIPSGELTNLPYLRKLGGLGTPLVLSTGMATMDEIAAAIAAIEQSGLSREQLTVLHCNTEYPTPMSDVNLRAMQTIASHFKVDVGYSDHTAGIEISIAAVAMGAQIIEKHFTLDKNLPGPDHKASLSPAEMSIMICAIRNLEQALGDGVKKPTPSEEKNRPVARKSIVASAPIKAGDIFSTANLSVKRPGIGISPMEWDRLIGTPASRGYQVDELISAEER